MATPTRNRRLAALAVVVVAASAGCRDDGDAVPVTSRVTDPAGDVRPAPTSDTPQPPGIDLVAAELVVDDDTLSFTATTADEGAVAERTWVVRFRESDGSLLYMLYASGSSVFLCDHARFCSDVAEGASVRTSLREARVRMPMALFRDLPDRLRWEASASGVFTANIDDTWNDFAPEATLTR